MTDEFAALFRLFREEKRSYYRVKVLLAGEKHAGKTTTLCMLFRGKAVRRSSLRRARQHSACERPRGVDEVHACGAPRGLGRNAALHRGGACTPDRAGGEARARHEPLGRGRCSALFR